MVALLDLYAPSQTALHRLDPRAKLLSTAVGFVLLFFLGAFWPLVVVAAFLVALLGLARIGGRRGRFVARSSLPLLLLILITWPLFSGAPGDVLATLGPLEITAGDLWAAGSIVLRVLCWILLFFLLLFTTRQSELVRGLTGLGLPYRAGFGLALAFRYLPTFGAALETTLDAQRTRGAEVDRGSLVRRVRYRARALIPAIISALRLAESLALSLEARGFGSERERTALRRLRWRPVDLVVLALVLGAGALFLWLRLTAGTFA